MSPTYAPGLPFLISAHRQTDFANLANLDGGLAVAVCSTLLVSQRQFALQELQLARETFFLERTQRTAHHYNRYTA